MVKENLLPSSFFLLRRAGSEPYAQEKKVSLGRGAMCALWVAVSLFVSAFAAFAQDERGAVTGTVTDQDGAVVSGAAVQAKNVGTGAIYKTTSSATGNYKLEQLPAGTYILTNPVLGLMYRQENVVVQASQTLRLDLRVVDNSLNTLGEDRAYFAGLDAPHATRDGPTPRTPDGKPDLSGVWWEPRVVDIGEATVLPWAAAVMKERTANLAKDLPRTRCLPNATTLLGRFGVNRLVQTPALLVVLTEADVPGYREIFLDGRGHPKDLDPTWTGHSIGKWEGDTLVVDTVGFNDKSWLADLPSVIMPHSEMLHLTTRFRRPDLGHLETEVTFNDLGTFTKPLKMKAISDLAENEDVQEWICNENNQDVEHLVGK
jgi:carboxypeptidase family protein